MVAKSNIYKLIDATKLALPGYRKYTVDVTYTAEGGTEEHTTYEVAARSVAASEKIAKLRFNTKTGRSAIVKQTVSDVKGSFRLSWPTINPLKWKWRVLRAGRSSITSAGYKPGLTTLGLVRDLLKRPVQNTREDHAPSTLIAMRRNAIMSVGVYLCLVPLGVALLWHGLQADVIEKSLLGRLNPYVIAAVPGCFFVAFINITRCILDIKRIKGKLIEIGSHGDR